MEQLPVISDKDLKTVFGPDFVQFAKNNLFLYPITDHGRTGNNPYIFYPYQEIAKAAQIFHRYITRTSPDDLDLLRFSVHGLIPRDEFNHMKQSQWWPEIDNRFRKLKSLNGSNIGLDDVISPYVIDDVVYRPRFRRHQVRGRI